MPPIPRCLAEEAWTAQSIAPPALSLLAECRLLGGCATGQAKLTDGYRLPAKNIIHTVGPVWNGGENGEPELLASCYRSCFAIASDHGLRTLAFPAISCGVYRFPVDLAVKSHCAKQSRN